MQVFELCLHIGRYEVKNNYNFAFYNPAFLPCAPHSADFLFIYPTRYTIAYLKIT